MRFDVLTLFPEMVKGPLEASILKRAQSQGKVAFYVHDIREVATDSHKTVDDTPYGGGAGMLLKVDIIDAALQKLVNQAEIQAIDPNRRCIILLTPQGSRFIQPVAQDYSKKYEQITLICGHYEGFDERIRSLVDFQISIGDFVLTGGELAALVVIDAISRLLPEVLNDASPHEESFSITDNQGKPLLEYPQYTRPAEYKGMKVPEILLSGDHAKIASWRLEQAEYRTNKQKEQE